MPVVVSLRSVVDEIDMLPNGATAYLNRKTGELFTVPDEEMLSIEDDIDLEDIHDWQREQILQVREISESEDWLPLPTTFDIHHWSIMDEFSGSQEDFDLRDELQNAIRAKGAFRHFKNTI